MKLQVDHLTFAYGAERIVEDISLHVKKGEFVGLIGPNGSGKSTLLKAIYKAMKPDSGAVLLEGEDLLAMNPKQAALKLGVVGQENDVPFDFKVEDIVAMGRSPHKKLFEGDTQEDMRIVRNAMRQTGLQEKAARHYSSLSGGEKQRVLVARALAQQTPLLIMDEPTNHLDIYYQLQMFDLVKNLEATVLAAIHDLNMAALYCTRLYVIRAGKLRASGAPKDVLTPELIHEVYGVHADIVIHPKTRRVSITYLPEGIANKGER
ncbi:ABC transporter ATP-binding protein [Paenibacillus sp. HB172176]|uniref:ABC transporter ATP-binding protein n=1 Tax=Paenibacillus sp. HB172176 TaxID=2493690 RepID=UPI00143C7E64|nr:ABC transporter ATP-binding protein [Paenibacillus sp. HB172176]